MILLNEEVTRLENNIKQTKEKINKVEDSVVEIQVLRQTVESLEKVGGDNTAELAYKMIQQKREQAEAVKAVKEQTENLKKITDSQFRSLEKDLIEKIEKSSEIRNQVAKLEEVIQGQDTLIQDLIDRLENLEEKVEEVQNNVPPHVEHTETVQPTYNSG